MRGEATPSGMANKLGLRMANIEKLVLQAFRSTPLRRYEFACIADRNPDLYLRL